MGIGTAGGENRAAEAAKIAISSPLLEESVEGATGILLNITGGHDLGLFEVNEAAEIVQSAADPNSNIIFGAVIDERMGDEVRVTVIATGFDHGRARPRTARETTAAATRRDRDVTMRRSPALVARDPRRRDRHPVVPARTASEGLAGRTPGESRVRRRRHPAQLAVRAHATARHSPEPPRTPATAVLASLARRSRRDPLRRTPRCTTATSPPGAKLVPFAGWEMPVQYAGIRAEHLAVRTRRGRLRRLAHGRDRDARARTPRRSCSACSPTTSPSSPRAARSTACSAARTAACSTTSSPTGWPTDRFLTVTNAANHEQGPRLVPRARRRASTSR